MSRTVCAVATRIGVASASRQLVAHSTVAKARRSYGSGGVATRYFDRFYRGTLASRSAVLGSAA